MAVVDVRGLSKWFGAKPAVQDLSFRLEPGQVTGFLGPNGAGKSTTMRLMLGLDSGSGTTLFDGMTYRQLPDPIRRVGALLDVKAFHPRRSARDHLAMLARGARLSRSRVSEVLELVGLAKAADQQPKGFSLGMSQRLGLAAALLGEPDTLILDEPANGMDPHGMRWLREYLACYAREGNTVLISSHLLSEIETLADRLIVIGQGRLVADSTVRDFIRGYNLEAVLVRSDQPEELAAVVDSAGGSVQSRAEDMLIVHGMDKRQIAEAAVARNILIFELSSTTATLEDAFLRASVQSDFAAQVG